jgi:hypothetical protein
LGSGIGCPSNGEHEISLSTRYYQDARYQPGGASMSALFRSVAKPAAHARPCLRGIRLHASDHPSDDGGFWMPADGTIEIRLWMHAEADGGNAC